MGQINHTIVFQTTLRYNYHCTTMIRSVEFIKIFLHS